MVLYQYAINIRSVICFNNVIDLIDLVSPARKEKIGRFCFDKDKIHSLFAELLLRFALWEQYGLEDNQVRFKTTKYGKPYLPDLNHVFFNLSHSGEWILCGVSDKPVGIDVEQVNNNQNLIMADKLYTDEEIKYIYKQSLDDRIKAFYRIWTLKESYVKCIGKGMSVPFYTFSFRIRGQEILLYSGKERKEDFLFRVAQLDDQHLTALCIYSRDEEILYKNIRILKIEEIRRWKGI